MIAEARKEGNAETSPLFRASVPPRFRERFSLNHAPDKRSLAEQSDGCKYYGMHPLRPGRKTSLLWVKFLGALFCAGLSLLAVVPLAGADGTKTPTVWHLENAQKVGTQEPLVLGAPQPVDEPAMGRALHFNGISDGLILPAIPITGWAQFTIEVLFKPESGGKPEQRFMHVEDAKGGRTMMETRLTEDNHWYLDTFLLSGPSSLALIDKTKLHPADRWSWVALRYDGKVMTSFVDGVKELEGPVAFAPLVDGKMSLGVRQNRLYWFKGAIREVRFTPVALPEGSLQRIGAK